MKEQLVGLISSVSTILVVFSFGGFLLITILFRWVNQPTKKDMQNEAYQKVSKAIDKVVTKGLVSLGICPFLIFLADKEVYNFLVIAALAGLYWWLSSSIKTIRQLVIEARM